MAPRSDRDAAPLLPDYQGAWLGGVVPALLGGEAATPLPEAALQARAHVLLTLDGLGWQLVRQHAALLPTVAGAMAGAPVTTVAPSTTAAALTSLTTGVSPAEHGVLGYRMRVGGRGLNVLRWQVPGAGKAGGDKAKQSKPDPERVQPVPPFLGRAVPVVTKAEFAKTGFTVAHLRGTDFRGWHTVSALLERVAAAVAQGQRFVYAYYDGVDKVAHEYGLHSAVFRTELVLTDRLVADLLQRLPDDVCLVVTADHGQVQVGPQGAVGLEPVAGMVAAYSGEGRFRGLHARTGAAGDLLAACEERYGDRAWVRSREQLFDDGWFGKTAPGLEVRGRVGDVVLAARDPVVFVDPGNQNETKMQAQHGSLTPAEMLVPLLAARGWR